MGKILLFIGIAYFVILFLAMCCPAPVKKGEEWRCSLNGVLMKEGINEKEKDMYSYQGKVPGIDFDEVIINCMVGNKCVGKKWYRRRNGVWGYYKSRDSESIWYEKLDNMNYTPEEGIAFCKMGCKYNNRTWEEEKNELIKDYFPDNWFAAEEYFEYLSQKQKEKYGNI